MSKVEKWKSGKPRGEIEVKSLLIKQKIRSKKFADKAKNNCENICAIGYSFVSLQHSCKTDKMQRNLRTY